MTNPFLTLGLCSVEEDRYPPDLTSIFSIPSASVSQTASPLEHVDEAGGGSASPLERAEEAGGGSASAPVEDEVAGGASADSYGECPLCGEFFPMARLQVGT